MRHIVWILERTSRNTYIVDTGKLSVEAKVQGCDILVSEFELKSRYNVQFWTNTQGLDTVLQ